MKNHIVMSKETGEKYILFDDSYKFKILIPATKENLSRNSFFNIFDIDGMTHLKNEELYKNYILCK